MKRNFSRRIEAAFPVYNEKLQKEIKDVIDIQLTDNTKARLVDEKQSNIYNHIITGKSHRSQYEIYDYLKNS